MTTYVAYLKRCCQETVRLVKKIQVILADKDFVEQEVVRSVLPHVTLHLCIFHVLRAFNRGVLECNLSTQQRTQVCSIFEQLLYADSESQFNEIQQQMQAFPTVATYYNRCWACCKHEWAMCYTKSHVTFGIRTNNFVESMNQKIKFVPNHNTTFYDGVEKLLKLLSFKQQEMLHRNAEAATKKVIIYNSKLPLEFCSKLTPAAVKEVNRQFEKASKWTEDIAYEQLLIKSRQYVVDDRRCSCSFFQSFNLTCAHLFFMRLTSGAPLYVDGEISSTNRWTIEFSLQDQYVESAASHISVATGSARTRSKTEKYRYAMAIFKPLADELSECGEVLFQTYMRCCEDLVNCIKTKTSCCVVSVENTDVPDQLSDDQDVEVHERGPPLQSTVHSVPEDDSLGLTAIENTDVSERLVGDQDLEVHEQVPLLQSTVHSASEDDGLGRMARTECSSDEGCVHSQAVYLCGELSTRIDRLLTAVPGQNVDAAILDSSFDHNYAKHMHKSVTEQTSPVTTSGDYCKEQYDTTVSLAEANCDSVPENHEYIHRGQYELFTVSR